MRWIVLVASVLALGCDEPAPMTEDAGPGVSMDAGGGEPDAGNSACFDGTNASGLGGECNCMADCADGFACTPESMPGGGPRGTCTIPCTSGGDECGTDGTCEIVAATGMGICRQTCSTSADCERPGYWCNYGRCGPICTEDTQCSSGHCDAYNGQCDDGAPSTGGGVLAECSRDEDCRSGSCLTTIGGHCVTLCTMDDPVCPEDAVCTPVDMSEPNIGMCLTRCTTSADCPGDLECLRYMGDQICFRSA